MSNVPAKKSNEPASNYGPAMSALSEKEQVFVEAYMSNKSGSEACRIAGYGNDEGTSTPETMAKIAYRLVHRDRIIAAFTEVSKQAVRKLVPQALQAMSDIVNDRHGKDRFNAARFLLAKHEPEVTKIDAHVTHEIVDHTAEAIAQLRALKQLQVPQAKLLEVFGYGGLQKYEQALALEDKRNAAIEVEFSEIVDPDFNSDGSLK